MELHEVKLNLERVARYNDDESVQATAYLGIAICELADKQKPTYEPLPPTTREAEQYWVDEAIRKTVPAGDDLGPQTQELLSGALVVFLRGLMALAHRPPDNESVCQRTEGWANALAHLGQAASEGKVVFSIEEMPARDEQIDVEGLRELIITLRSVNDNV